MVRVTPTGDLLGARIDGIDLSRPLDNADCSLIREACGIHGVRCFSHQDLAPRQHKAFAAHFGSLEVNVAAETYTVPDHPEVMILSNVVEGSRAIGLKDAGQDWHTDLSYSRDIAYLNI